MKNVRVWGKKRAYQSYKNFKLDLKEQKRQIGRKSSSKRDKLEEWLEQKRQMEGIRAAMLRSMAIILEFGELNKYMRATIITQINQSTKKSS